MSTHNMFFVEKLGKYQYFLAEKSLIENYGKRKDFLIFKLSKIMVNL